MIVYLLNARSLADREGAALAMLSPARRERALRCRPQGPRLCLMAGGLLLGYVLGIADESALAVNEWGKPALPGGPQFSLTHAGHYAALAVGEGPAGLDIESLDRPFRRLSGRYFTEEERRWLEADPTPERFYTLWTRLEALTKADGRGLLMSGRTQPLLDTEGPWYLRTFVHDGHLLSAAADRAFEPETTEVPIEEILR